MQVDTEIYYLRRQELYKKVKPYILGFTLPADIGPSTNLAYEPFPVTITDARPALGSFSLDKHGFQFEKWPTELQPTDFDDTNVVESKYYPQMISRLLKTREDIVDRRKRGPEFRKTATKDPDFPNPIVYAHADYTPYGAEVLLAEQLPPKYEHLRGLDYDIINVWRVTRGPNREWPLALCDFNSVDDEELEMSDVVHRKYVGEDLRLYHSPNHRWYFLGNQTTDEVILFRNTHSDGLHVPFGLHASFDLPDDSGQEDLPPRESIEFRAFRFFSTTRKTTNGQEKVK